MPDAFKQTAIFDAQHKRIRKLEGEIERLRADRDTLVDWIITKTPANWACRMTVSEILERAVAERVKQRQDSPLRIEPERL